jgi:uncharacterized protein with HEPN domain
MTARSWELYLSEMLGSMNKIERYIEGVTFDEFIKQDQLVDAVERNIEKIGEAAAAIPDSVRNQYPEIPWKTIVGLRNKIIHHYFAVNYEVVYQIAVKNIPETKPMIENVIKNYLKKSK